MNHLSEAYLDIETTGLSLHLDDITVIGIYIVHGKDDKLVQLFGEQVNSGNLLKTLRGTGKIYTYNGSRFDLPFIQTSLGIDLGKNFQHHDLMYDCWRNNLYGGLKSVEQQLGVDRQLKGINGYDAIKLWWRFRSLNDHTALRLLLAYNKEDLTNLKAVRDILL